MQVSDASSGATGPAPAPGDDPRSGRDAGEGGRRVLSGPRFRSALERKLDATGPGSEQSASAAALAGWFRPESGMAPATRTAAVAPASAARAADRILIGSGPDGAQARIHIGAGALAGTEIQLTTGAVAHAVEVRLLTHAASSRQTLSLVMDEIRVRLQNKGIAFSTRPAGDRSIGGGEPDRGNGNDAGGQTAGNRPGSSR